MAPVEPLLEKGGQAALNLLAEPRGVDGYPRYEAGKGEDLSVTSAGHVVQVVLLQVGIGRQTDDVLHHQADRLSLHLTPLRFASFAQPGSQ